MTRASHPAPGRTAARPAKPRSASVPPDAGQPNPRWRRRAADRPQEILEAALTVFLAKGFAGTRLDDVARAAGVSKGLLYRYFDTKAELFKDMVRQMLGATIRATAERLRNSATATEALDLFLEQVMGIAEDERRSAIPKLVISESGNFPELAAFYLTEVIGPAQQHLAALIRRGIAGGEFRRVDPVATAKLLIAPLLLAVIWRHTFAQHDTVEFDAGTLIRQHREILLHGLAAQGQGGGGRLSGAKRGRRST